ncbi:putative ring finger [Lyophyllum shimeji]|uniref:Ring finger n=1 Tax=Lyophyllum shimeji TaxID=47721 RepID=A0A9P3PSU5_LYOSH|nr:putative ring finger [Lyophyllum shimeji]
MLTLSPGSACDVCAEEYGPQCHPHSIPCGHVLCASCCSTIVEKTPSRLLPVCPFCRETFTGDSVRLIRMDFNSSGWSTPRRMPPHPIEQSQADFAEMWARKTERLLLSDGCSRTRQEARRLEDKVAKVAAKKCSVEEVSTLHRELEEWLTSDVKDDQTALHLSAALLRAILMNHLAHSEASRNAKTVEANLKAKVDDLEITTEKLEAELRKTVSHVTILDVLTTVYACYALPVTNIYASTAASIAVPNTCSPQVPNACASSRQVPYTIRTIANTVFTVLHSCATAHDAHDYASSKSPADANSGATSYPSQAPQVVHSVTPKNDDALYVGRES